LPLLAISRQDLLAGLDHFELQGRILEAHVRGLDEVLSALTA
jgi:hypothetical protein